MNSLFPTLVDQQLIAAWANRSLDYLDPKRTQNKTASWPLLLRGFCAINLCTCTLQVIKIPTQMEATIYTAGSGRKGVCVYILHNFWKCILCMCICIYIHTYIYTYIHTHTYTHTYRCKLVRSQTTGDCMTSPVWICFSFFGGFP